VTTIAVIQARTGSTRFPSKVLADLNGRPMLSHVVERVARCRSVDRVVVATSTGPSDDAVAELAVRAGASVTRGPLDDVLRRFVLAAHEHSASVVVRITADCPLVDPRLIDTLVEQRRSTDIPRRL
jgi:spore coat polysaccharide biosynthesis protein SpsF